MEIIKCTMAHWDAVAAFYDKVTAYLAQHVNYPKWRPGDYPGRDSTRAAIEEQIQYACVEQGKIIGAFILNADPGCDYDVGDWQRDLSRGEYLVIHTLAADPEDYRKGIGRFMVNYCICTAREKGYQAVRVDTVPENGPARRLYENLGFVFAGEKDLKRGLAEIPRFALYELLV